MRTLKENFFGNLGIGKIVRIEDWLKKYNIKNYTINSDYTIAVKGKVIFTYAEKELPEYIQFNYVDKEFNISGSDLSTLRGCPVKCDEFWCDNCKNLTSLEGAPKECRGFYCIFCEKLTSLEGAPKECNEFSCVRCENLTSLEGAPKKCKKFWCNFCKNLTSLEGAPKECKQFECIRCKGNFTEEDVKKVCKVEKIYC